MGGIYVHIPFCKTHCTYCAFYSELLRNAQGSESFVDAIVAEFVSLRAKGSGDTLYFGGGTPSVLSVDQLRRIVSAVFDSGLALPDEIREFTMEVNPDDIVRGGMEYASGLRELGVNRISMGVQSFDDAVLHKMGRRHDASQAREAYRILRAAGFDNISLDFIFGFNDALDLDAMKGSLLSMGLPEHISCYQLSIEEGSGLDKMSQRGLFVMPSDEVCEAQYYAICDMLRGLGYEHYEISNWCLPGFHSRHNSSYWNHTPYLGLGPGAHSLIIGENGEYVRRWNNDSLREYIAAAGSGDWNSVRDQEILTPEQIREERIFLGLRTAEGILKEDGSRLRIPESKWFISDSIISDLL